MMRRAELLFITFVIPMFRLAIAANRDGLNYYQKYQVETKYCSIMHTHRLITKRNLSIYGNQTTIEADLFLWNNRQCLEAKKLAKLAEVPRIVS